MPLPGEQVEVASRELPRDPEIVSLYKKNGGAWSAAGELIWTEFKLFKKFKPFKMFLAEHGSRRAMSGLFLLCSSKFQ